MTNHRSDEPAMHVIGLQSKARPAPGRIEHYWFENEHTGLKRTQFHRIVIPFVPFDSGLDYVDQPEATELVVEWIELRLADPADLDGVVVAMGVTPHLEASIYLGWAHNPADIQELRLIKEDGHYRIRCKATIDFEHERVGKSELFEFDAVARYVGGVEA